MKRSFMATPARAPGSRLTRPRFRRSGAKKRGAAMVRAASGRADRLEGRAPIVPDAAPLREGFAQCLENGLRCLRRGPRRRGAAEAHSCLLLSGHHLVDDHRASRGDRLLRCRPSGLAYDHVMSHQQPGYLIGPAEDRGRQPPAPGQAASRSRRAWLRPTVHVTSQSSWASRRRAVSSALRVPELTM